MPYYVFRDHCCPVISNIHQTIMKWYKTEIQKYDCVPTSFAIDYKIRKKWKREDCQWQNISISIPVGSADIQFTAMAAESFNQYYNDIKPEGTFYVYGTENYSKSRCAICLERYGNKIRLINCNCLFHRNCIETSVKYRKVCPRCETTINMSHK